MIDVFSATAKWIKLFIWNIDKAFLKPKKKTDKEGHLFGLTTAEVNVLHMVHVEFNSPWSVFFFFFFVTDLLWEDCNSITSAKQNPHLSLVMCQAFTKCYLCAFSSVVSDSMWDPGQCSTGHFRLPETPIYQSIGTLEWRATTFTAGSMSVMCGPLDFYPS